MLRTLKITTVSVLLCNAKTRAVSDVNIDIISYPEKDSKKAAKMVDDYLNGMRASGKIAQADTRVAFEAISTRPQKTRMSDAKWLDYCEFIDDDEGDVDDDTDDSVAE